MYSFPIDYVEPVFRPPSEAKSLILPVTNGCSWNKCTFCEMYTQPQKKFRARKPEDVLQDIRNAARSLGGVRRVFLADGDAMVLPTRRLLEILGQLREAFPMHCDAFTMEWNYFCEPSPSLTFWASPAFSLVLSPLPRLHLYQMTPPPPSLAGPVFS